MTPEVVALLRALIKRIEIDTASGLLDRETIRIKNHVRLALTRLGINVDED